jgi:hypothetical protein
MRKRLGLTHSSTPNKTATALPTSLPNVQLCTTSPPPRTVNVHFSKSNGNSPGSNFIYDFPAGIKYSMNHPKLNSVHWRSFFGMDLRYSRSGPRVLA